MAGTNPENTPQQQQPDVDEAVEEVEAALERESVRANPVARTGLGYGDPHPGPGLLEDLGIDPDLSDVGRPPASAEPPDPIPSVRLARPASGSTADQSLWTLIRNRTNAISFNNYFNYVNTVLDQHHATGTQASTARAEISDLSFLGLDGYDVIRAITEYFLMHEAGLIVDNSSLPNGFTAEELQPIYDEAMGITPESDPRATSEYRRRNFRPLPQNWLVDLRDSYLDQLAGTATPKVLPYLRLIMDKLRDLPLKRPGEVGYSYGVLPSRLVGPLGIELIWSYWLEESMLVQAHNAVTNRFQNQRTVRTGLDPLARMEIDPLRRINNVLWGWIQARPFLLSVRRRAFEYDHHYGFKLLGTAVGEVDGADSRSQFVSAFHNLLHLCTIFYQQDDDLTVQADGFPLLNALRETQLVVAAGAHNQYGDLPWTARVEMLMQMWMFARPEMREFLGGRIMVPYKEPWMDRVDSVKSAMGWTDVNVTHFRDLGTFGEQLVLSVRYGSWSSEIEPDAAVNWARYWRPEIQGYVHAYRAATGADLRQTVDTTMPSALLQGRLAGPTGQSANQRALGARGGMAHVRAEGTNLHALP